MQKVYPRVCGGTDHAPHPAARLLGLSPRVRGNRPGQRRNANIWGSIPACAGEPEPDASGFSTVQVYPRVCGGTHAGHRPRAVPGGLSPRVRGNHKRRQYPCQTPRSIPACAGEPRHSQDLPAKAKVYPRVCGGTLRASMCLSTMRGLSPRVRGNRHLFGDLNPGSGSIPACAGEPPEKYPRRPPEQVYPRVCGGTCYRGVVADGAEGLSPRVRGNLHSLPEDAIKVGSIPACAGEPRRWSRGSAPGTVYPRVCGGTVVGDVLVGLPYGLSPRVRGNPGALRHLRPQAGSIPACAGEPKQCAPPA